MSRPGPRGFTKVELAVALGVIVIVMSFAIPYYMAIVRHTQATQIMAELYAVRAAGYTYFAEAGTWPREYAPGLTPEELVKYLPGAFSFRNKRYLLDWENWRRPDGSSRSPQTGILIGVSVVTNDRSLLEDVSSMVPSTAFRKISRRKSTLEILGRAGL